jgi:signal transduction histidine kinase
MNTGLSDQLIITGLTVFTCLLVGGIALLALRATRQASIRYQLIIAVLAPVIAVAAAVAISVRLMVLSRHDTGVIILALGVSLVLAAGLALLVTRRIVIGAAHLGAGISQLAPDLADQRLADGSGAAMPAELAGLMTELGTTRIRLAEARAAEQAAQTARQQLVRNLSHDLRTPLAGLRAMAEALEDGIVADVPLAMHQIRATVGRMDALASDLFELSRVQGGPPEREHKRLSISELIIDVADEAESTAGVKGVALRVDLPDADRLAISGDADDLARALGNLISNAIQYTPAGGTVTISAGREPAGNVTVAVTDGCGGIPEADLSRVFDAGWRGDLSRTAPDGAGLGLAIARGVVESHRGRIAVRNASGGCRFDVELPAPQ